MVPGLPLQPTVPPQNTGKDRVRGHRQCGQAPSSVTSPPAHCLPVLDHQLHGSTGGQGMGELLWTTLFF